MPGSSLDGMLTQISDAYQAWGKVTKLKLHTARIDRETFGLENGLKASPIDTWSKFSDTRVLLCFLEDKLRDQLTFTPNEITVAMLAVVTAAHVTFRGLYRSGFWLTEAEASRCAGAGMSFLHAYAAVANSCLVAGRLRFPTAPKIHDLHHSFRQLYLQRNLMDWSPSPLRCSVQLGEDLVGKVARVSRRVGNVLQMLRFCKCKGPCGGTKWQPVSRLTKRKGLWHFGIVR